MTTMGKTAVLFDVDGTLVKSERIDAVYFVQALRDVAGTITIADDWSCYKKVTDVGIITEILEQNGRNHIVATVTEVRQRFGVLLKAYFDDGGTCVEVPGAKSLLDLLRSSNDYSIGIATGGWKHTAFMKCTKAGIDLSIMPMSTSDDGDERPAIMLHCLQKMGSGFDRIVYIGDGVWDRDASKELGWNFIGIGKKMREKCDVWFEDYSDIGAVMGMVDGC